MNGAKERSATSYSLMARAKRNAKTILQILRIVKIYFTAGASVRRNYREKQRRGEVYYFD